jgi:hypothetical protein
VVDSSPLYNKLNLILIYACIFHVGVMTVVGNALSRNPKLGEVVARVNILAAEG